MATYRPGELSENIIIKRETLTPDDMGGNTLALTNVHTCRAHVRPMSGGERNNWDQLNSANMYLFVIRYRTGILATDRITWRGYTFNIRQIDDKGPRSMYLEIAAEKGVAL